MKRFLLFLVLLWGIPFRVFPQCIASISVFPPTPDDSDEIFVDIQGIVNSNIVNTYEFVEQRDTTIRITKFIYTGILPIITNWWQRVPIGKLHSGNYSVNLSLYVCPDSIFLCDFPCGMFDFSFTVKGNVRKPVTHLLVDSIVGRFGDTVSVPVSANIPDGKAYNSAELRFSGYGTNLDTLGIKMDSTLMKDWKYAFNERNDTIILAMAGSDSISSSGTLFNLRFIVRETSCDFPFVPIKIVSAIFDTTSDSIAFVHGGVQLVSRYGDANLDRVLDTSDVRTVLNSVVGLDSLNCRKFNNADVTRDGTISALDAFFIRTQPDSLPVDTSNGRLHAEGSVDLVSDFTEWQINPVVVKVNLYSRRNIKSIQGIFSISPPSALRFNNFDSVSSDGLVSLYVDTTEGIIRFAIAGTFVDGSDTLSLPIELIGKVETTNVTIELKDLFINETSIAGKTLQVVINDIQDDGQEIPLHYKMNQNYPNPFNPTTTIRIDIPKEELVVLTVYNVHGQEVATLVKERMTAGSYKLQWDASNFPTGLYMYRMQAGNPSSGSGQVFTEVKRMILLK
ncbi:MAG: T9SS type A sorting domain-containing protein [Ignavibacteriae bacterium]|nr:T9SS type A sorting domain-containing protein [Ignavibacteriota bacterium]